MPPGAVAERWICIGRSELPPALAGTLTVGYHSLLEGGFRMPIYEYICLGCRGRFEKIVSASAQPSCPHCGGTQLEQQFSTFAVGSSTAHEPLRAAGACGSCGDPRGPGSCGLN